jgi:peptidoglycan/LPS O-acetylase OafA/YrhL
MDRSRAEDLRPLTSLRFVDAMMIVLFHAKNYFHWPFLAYVPSTASFGVSCVSFFFVLSGFILTHVYSSKPFPGYWRFIVLRFGRLWPVHMAATSIVVASVFARGAIIRADSLTFQGSGFLFNRWTELALVTGLSQSLSPYMAHFYAWNSVSWSISTEFFFYLAFPFLLIDIKRSWHWKLLVAGATAALLTSALLLLGIPISTSDPFAASISEIITINPLGRVFEFSLGMAAWVLWDRYIRSVHLTAVTATILEALILAAALAWCFDGYWKATVLLPMALQPCFGPAWAFAIVIIVLASGRGWIGKFLSTAPMVLLGEVSFSIYMLHQIMMKIYFSHGSIDQPPIVFFAPLIAISTAAYFLIECPARNFVARYLKRSRLGEPAIYIKS